MLLFPCSKIQGTPKIGFTITNTCPSLKCFARIFLDGQIIQEPVLDNINTFIEIGPKKTLINFLPKHFQGNKYSFSNVDDIKNV